MISHFTRDRRSSRRDRARSGYRTAPFPVLRRLVIDSGRLGRRKSNVHGLFEIDVTDTRRHIRAHRRASGRPLSLTAYIVYCLGQTLAADPQMHAMIDWRGRMVLFDDVDLVVMVELGTADDPFPAAHLVRAVNRLAPTEIEASIQAMRERPTFDRSWRFMRWFLHLPGFLRLLIYRVVLTNPGLVQRYAGTSVVTALGMFGAGGGWVIPNSQYTLSVSLGGLARKPAYVGGELLPREMLAVTISVDHDVVDGAPAARFARRLKTLIESGEGLTGDAN